MIEKKSTCDKSLRMEVSVKNMPDGIFFTRLFVPQAPQTSHYRRAKSDIWLAIPPTPKRLRNGVSMKEIKWCHKVQYYETDQMGVIHHSNYIRWFEESSLVLGSLLHHRNNRLSL